MTDETRPLDTLIDRPSPDVIKAYATLSPNELSDVLELSCVMRYEIHPLWPGMPRIASLDDWERRHRSVVEAALEAKGYRL